MIGVLSAILFSISSQAAMLTLVSPAESAYIPIDARFSVIQDYLYVKFDVGNKKINAKRELGADERPYDYDVVEVFVSVNGEDRLPYYEFELTPLNQTWEVRVDHPKRPFAEGLKLGFQAKATMTKNGWQAEMWIPLKALGWDGDVKKVYGNAFAIQGFGKKRSFWSLFLPPANKARFHQPEYFKPLLPHLH